MLEAHSASALGVYWCWSHVSIRVC